MLMLQEKFEFIFSLLSAREGRLEYPENIIWKKLLNFLEVHSNFS
jgi:hypothetical protein